MSTNAKKYYRCHICGSKTSTTIAARAAAKVCVNCRPDLDARPAPKAKAKPVAPRAGKPAAAETTPTFERVPGTLAAARRLIGIDADFEFFRAEGNTVMYLYEEPAEAPARSFTLTMTKRRLTDPQFNMKFGSLHRQGKMVGLQVTEIMLDPAAPENAADATPVAETAPEADAPTDPAVDAPAMGSPTPEGSDAPPPAATPNALEADAHIADVPAAVTPSKRKKVSALDAAALVLRQSGIAMSAKEILAAILEQGLWTSPKGKTPEMTIAAAAGREIQIKGSASRFVKAERGKFAANLSPEDANFIRRFSHSVK